MSADSGVHARPGPISAIELHAADALNRSYFWFRLLNHATLAMAGVCLVHGEAFFLPLLPWCLVPYFCLLIAAFRAEGRWVLPNSLANLAGLLIVIGMGWWVAHQSGGLAAVANFDTLARLVPSIGPFMMALLTVQLFRARGPQDFWVLQGMGFVQVALGCVLASSPLFGLLMAIYLVCALTSLALHYLFSPGTIGKPPTWRWLVAFVASYTLVVAASSLVVFLITPRSDAAPWDPLQQFGSRAAQSTRWPQYAPNHGANLNGTSRIELSNDPAFTIRAVDVHGPKLDLPADIRFRTFVLETYQDGVWPTDLISTGYRGMGLQRSRYRDLVPDFGHGQYIIHFDVSPEVTSGLVLAEPVILGGFGETRSPVVLTDFNKPHAPLFYVQPYSGTLLQVPNLAWKRYRYRQVMARIRDPNRIPAQISGGRAYIQELTRQGLPRLETWTAALLRRLVQDRRYGLSPGALAPDPRWPDRSYIVPEVYWEPVARALCDYLTSSGEYTYSLEQLRKDFNFDPIEDFLFNVKQGHCERYASALVLMLRTQGVPCRMIKGYRGADSTGGGAYVIRQNMAHAWVEVLVKRTGDGAGPGHEWLTLDPTPGVEAARQPSPVAEWWHDKTSAGANMWQRLIVGYDATRQGEVLGAISPPSVLSVILLDSLKYVLPEILGLAVVIVVLVLRIRHARQQMHRPASATTLFGRLNRLLARRGHIRRVPWQTPREFAAIAGAFLRRNAPTEALAELPGEIVDAFYRERFGRQLLAAADFQKMSARLEQLARSLPRIARAI